ncbi:glycoside hydrolase domain-containing protein [Spirillospora sp. CA-294931]|uniref:glycoside hydrolase domain-containing protein n=1 Tax=Spirillospora sp. CA-294931 TaxID=3240042 RepID=UPI003D943670
MRNGAVFVRAVALVAVAPLVPGPGEAAARAAADPAAPLTTAYRGVRIAVPPGWDVHRLDRDPSRCVRLDRDAIYLGRPADQQDCPARLVGGADVVHVEPLDRGRGARRAAVRPDRLASYTVPANDARGVELALPEAGVKITATYGTDPAALQSVIRSARLSGSWTPEPTRAAPAPSNARTTAERPKRWAVGRGFDTCAAPSLNTMAAWRRSYGISNIYIGGAARGCAQYNLSARWVRAVRAMKYRLIPTYVGLQAPCTRYRSRFTPANAAREGSRAAADAVYRARRLGIPRRMPIYFDIEGYDSGKAWCRNAVMTFLHSYSRRMTALKYTPAVYSSVASGIRDLGRATGITKPRAIWFAHWDGSVRMYGNPYLLDHWWHPHRRIKQYRGGHKEKHGGITLNIDSNYVDGRVY